MTAATVIRSAAARTLDAHEPLSTLTWSAAIAAASEAVVLVPLDDQRWTELGPKLTAFVDVARRAIVGSGSPIGTDESVPVVLRLRDLGHLARAAATADGPGAGRSTKAAEGRLRSLQIAALR